MKYTFGIAAASLALVLPAANAQATPEVCVATYLGMNFAFRNYDMYDSYFHNDSTVQLAQAGIYTGPDAIAEYVKFANPENAAIATQGTVNQTFDLTGIDGDTCEFFVVGVSHYTFTELFSNGTLDVGTAFRMYLNLTSGKFDRLHVFYDVDYLVFFGGMTANPPYQEWLCGVMENDCTSAWNFSNVASQADCKSRLAALPTVTGATAGYDGNSQACRSLHGALARLNPVQHCAHISFDPMEDPNGKIKCQTSSEVDATGLFTTAQMAAYEVFKSENGLPPSGYTASIPCDTDDAFCPNDEICVAGVCAEPGVVANQTNSSTTVVDTMQDDGETGAAYNMHVTSGAFLLLLAAYPSTP